MVCKDNNKVCKANIKKKDKEKRKRNKTKFNIILNAIALYLKFLLSAATRAGSPQKDVLPDTEKRILNSTITKTTCIMRKSTKNYI